MPSRGWTSTVRSDVTAIGAPPWPTGSAPSGTRRPCAGRPR
jgi:hypothetical protein